MEVAITNLRKMRYHRLANGATIQGNRSPSLHKCNAIGVVGRAPQSPNLAVDNAPKCVEDQY